MTPILLAGPATEPLSVAEAKAWLRLDTSDEDAPVAALITAARMRLETSSRRQMISQQWRLVADTWPPDGLLRLPLAPVRTVTALRVYDAAGIAHPVAADRYRVEAARDPALIILTGPAPQPGRATGGIEIDVEAGFGAAASAVPELLRHAMRLLVAHWFENRGDAAAGGDGLPRDIAQLIAPYTRPRL